MAVTDVIDMNELDHSRFRSWAFSQDLCVTCGLCSSSCPASGVGDLGPMNIFRLDKSVRARFYPQLVRNIT